MIIMSSNTFLDTSFSHIVSSLTKTFHFIGRALQATCRSVPEKRLRLVQMQLHSQAKASNSDTLGCLEKGVNISSVAGALLVFSLVFHGRWFSGAPEIGGFMQGPSRPQLHSF